MTSPLKVYAPDLLAKIYVYSWGGSAERKTTPAPKTLLFTHSINVGAVNLLNEAKRKLSTPNVNGLL